MSEVAFLRAVNGVVSFIKPPLSLLLNYPTFDLKLIEYYYPIINGYGLHYYFYQFNWSRNYVAINSTLSTLWIVSEMNTIRRGQKMPSYSLGITTLDFSMQEILKNY